MNADCVLEGEKVRLRPVEEADLLYFRRWLSDPEVRLWLDEVNAPPTCEEELSWFERAKQADDRFVWSIETLGQRLLGTMDLRWSHPHQRGSFGVFIGDKAMWDHGFGTEAVRVMLRFAFQELGLNRVELHVHEGNARAIRCYEKCNFQREGLLRRHRLTEDGFANTVVMAILREEFEAQPWR